eukprot:Nitzschia sp. Nitz4//scaffold36_size144017//113760//115246//NITZ4_003111-RA/size144017-snap-gene-0.216-mRNA-1//-1//CDS//3329549531//8979//frame0
MCSATQTSTAKPLSVLHVVYNPTPTPTPTHMKFGLLTNCTRAEEHCIESSVAHVPPNDKEEVVQGEKLEELYKLMLQWTEETKLLNHQLRSNAESNADDDSALSGTSTKGSRTTHTTHSTMSQLQDDSFEDITNESSTTPQTSCSAYYNGTLHPSTTVSTTVVSNLPEVALAEEILKLKDAVHGILRTRFGNLNDKVKTLELEKYQQGRDFSDRKSLKRETRSMTQTGKTPVSSYTSGIKNKRSAEALKRRERARLRRTQAQSQLVASMSVLKKYTDHSGDETKKMCSKVENMSSEVDCFESSKHTKKVDMLVDTERKAMESQIQKLKQENNELIVRLRNHEEEEVEIEPTRTETLQEELDVLKQKFAEKTSIREAHIADLEEQNELMGAKLKLLESMVQMEEGVHRYSKPAVLSSVPDLWNRIHLGVPSHEKKPFTTTTHIVTI